MDEREEKNLIIRNYFKVNSNNRACPYYKNNKIKINDDIYLTKKLSGNDNDKYEIYTAIIKINNKNYKMACRLGFNSNVEQVPQGKSIHFPVYYGYKVCYYYTCKEYKEIKDIANLPLILQKSIINIKAKKIPADISFEVGLHSKLPLIFTNLGDGNLNDFTSKSKLTEKQLFDFIAQIYLTMYFITIEIEKIDVEKVATTFLFEKIKKKTDFYYKINNINYCLPKSDYLFTINKIKLNKNANLNKNLKIITDYFLSLRILTPAIKLFLTNINSNKSITFDSIIKSLVENNVLLDVNKTKNSLSMSGSKPN